MIKVVIILETQTKITDKKRDPHPVYKDEETYRIRKFFDNNLRHVTSNM